MFSRFCTADKRKYEFSFQFKREGCFFPDSYYLITSRQDAQICTHLMLMKARLSRRRALKAGIVPFFDKWSFAFFTCLVIKRQKPEMKASNHLVNTCEMKCLLSIIRTKNQHCAIAICKIWYLWNSLICILSSPRAESARAVTGRQCPHSGVGEDFLACRPFFLQKGPFLGNQKSKNQSEGAKSTVSARSTNGLLTKSRVL